jgi:hypothetical protein
MAVSWNNVRMNDTNRRSIGGIGERTPRLENAIAAAANAKDVTIGLPDTVTPGRLAFTYMADPWGSAELQAQDIRFDWDGGRMVTWTEDISADEAISPGSSSPTHGWASWVNGEDLFLAYANPDNEFEGWARIQGAAPIAGAAGQQDDEAILSDQQRWLKLARLISEVVGGQQPDGMTGEQFSN